MGKKSSGLSKHHKRPRSRGGDNGKGNISRVSKHKHKAWHTLFDNKNPHEIAEEINQKWLDSDFYFIVKKKC